MSKLNIIQIQFSKRENHMKQNRVIEPVSLSRPSGVAVSHHVAVRVFFPGHVVCMDELSSDYPASDHAFEAIYRNALGFLEKIAAEEGFR